MSVPDSILYKSIAGRYRPVSYPDGPITARYRFIKNAYWGVTSECHVKMVICKTLTGTLANSADPDQTPQNTVSDQSLHCLLKLQEVMG